MNSNRLKRDGYTQSWHDYEKLDDEPSTRYDYDLSPELEDAMLEHSPLLKKRVWRNMQKMRKHKHSRGRMATFNF